MFLISEQELYLVSSLSQLFRTDNGLKIRCCPLTFFPPYNAIKNEIVRKMYRLYFRMHVPLSVPLE